MYKKFFTTILLASLVTAAQAQSTEIRYEAFCYEGKVSARQINAGTSPTKPLLLMIDGVWAVPCKDGDTITIGAIGEVKETLQEGLNFSATVLITPKSGEIKTIFISRFQQKPFPRSLSGKETMI